MWYLKTGDEGVCLASPSFLDIIAKRSLVWDMYKEDCYSAEGWQAIFILIESSEEATTIEDLVQEEASKAFVAKRLSQCLRTPNKKPRVCLLGENFLTPQKATTPSLLRFTKAYDVEEACGEVNTQLAILFAWIAWLCTWSH